MAIVEYNPITGADGVDSRLHKQRFSHQIDIGDTLEMVLGPVVFPHLNVGVVMFNAGGARVKVDAGGTFTIKFKTWNSDLWETVPSGTLDATAMETIDFSGDWAGMQVVPSGAGFVDAATYEVRVTAFRS